MFQFATNGTEHPHLQLYMGTYQVQTNHINLEVMCVFLNREVMCVGDDRRFNPHHPLSWDH